jgi:hypothetical protein
VNFGGWLSLDDAPATAPDGPGVLQARGDALLAYPRGRSAMVLYACSRGDETLRRYVTAPGPGAVALGRAAHAGARWVRFGSSPAPAAELERLMRRFVDRFGAPPAANTHTTGSDSQYGNDDDRNDEGNGDGNRDDNRDGNRPATHDNHKDGSPHG